MLINNSTDGKLAIQLAYGPGGILHKSSSWIYTLSQYQTRLIFSASCQNPFLPSISIPAFVTTNPKHHSPSSHHPIPTHYPFSTLLPPAHPANLRNQSSDLPLRLHHRAHRPLPPPTQPSPAHPHHSPTHRPRILSLHRPGYVDTARKPRFGNARFSGGSGKNERPSRRARDRISR